MVLRRIMWWFVTAAWLGGAGLRPASAALIGVDGVHGGDAAAILATGAHFADFRATIRGLGHTLVPLTTFEPGDLAGLDGLILNTPYYKDGIGYTASERSAVAAFVRGRAVFLSDTSLWCNDGGGSERPIAFGDNRLLLENILLYISGGGGLLVTGEGASGFDVEGLNRLVAPFGITYAPTPTERSGHTVSGFLPHPVTAGLDVIGVDYHLRITADAPSRSLTGGAGADDVLAVLAVGVPEPTSILVVLPAALLLAATRRRRDGSAARPPAARRPPGATATQ